MARYLVTGGCGFIGANLTWSLSAAGHEVVVLDNLSTGYKDSIPSEAIFVDGDVSDPDEVYKVLKLGIDGCFHLAANPSVSDSVNNYLECNKINLGGTLSVFDAISKFSNKFRDDAIPVVYASSCAVYGKSEIVPISEVSPKLPLSGYGADKLCGEIHAGVASRLMNIPSIGLRFFNIFGPGQRPESEYSGVLSIFCERLLASKDITIFGDGQQLRDFVFVDDTVGALQVAMEKVKKHSPGIFNVCRGKGISILDVGKIISQVCGKSFNPNFEEEREGDIRQSVGNPQNCANSLGWTAKTDISLGITETVKWLANQS